MIRNDRIKISIITITALLCLFFILSVINVKASYSDSVFIPAPTAVYREGLCSWYSKNDPTDPFKHKYNADGSAFSENALTCAMASRDFGKYYRVINLSNNKSVIVQHRDYNPFKRYKGRDMSARIIDLSRAAFTRIEDLDKGLTRVKIERIR